LLSEWKQRQIVRLYFEEKRSCRAIAEELGCHRETVLRCIERYKKSKEQGKKNRSGSGEPTDWIAKPKTKGKWDGLLKEAEERVRARKRDKKIRVMDLYKEIRENRSFYESFGLKEDEPFTYSSLYLAWRLRNQGSDQSNAVKVQKKKASPGGTMPSIR
jgi:transposase-like protein